MQGTKQRDLQISHKDNTSHLWIGKLKCQEPNISKKGFWMTGKGEVGKRAGGTVFLTDLQCQWIMFSTTGIGFG